MQSSKLRLDNCFVSKLVITTGVNENPGHRAEKPDNRHWQTNVSYTLLQEAEGKLCFFLPLKLDIDCHTDDSANIQRIELELNGYFSLPEGTPEEEVAQYVPLLCVTNLYGIARGIVAQATGTFAEGTLYLPLVDVTQLIANGGSTPAQEETVPASIEG